jgi:hypothetical protein
MSLRRKKKIDDAPVAITVLTGELANIDRSIDVLQAMSGQAAGDDALIELAANRIAGAVAARKHIRAINRAMAGRVLTEIRKSSGPMEALINGRKIGGEELMAIQDIETAINAMAGAGMIRPVSLEIKSAGMRRDWSKSIEDSVENYRHWADFWSKRRTYGDRTSEIVVRAVVHGHAFGLIERDSGIQHGRGAVIAVRGLRDYAARAGWVSSGVARAWMEEAASSFKGTALGELGLSVARAKRSTAR